MVLSHNFKFLLFSICCRLFSDILKDAAAFLDLLAPMFRGYFMFIACLSSIAKVGGLILAFLFLKKIMSQSLNMAVNATSSKDRAQESEITDRH